MELYAHSWPFFTLAPKVTPYPSSIASRLKKNPAFPPTTA